ncbi:ferric reductase NAD binding domain-containing protein [Pyronema omphalodes]|nr:ferric reductase NAD binding domain-containing protein [Pyronema omphalodes]
MHQVSVGKPDPARPKNLLSTSFATATAISREICNYTIPLIPRPKEGESGTWNDRILKMNHRLTHLPPLGYLLLMGANLSLLLAFIFFYFKPENQRQYEMIAVRAGWMTLTQLPLVFLMAGKANIVGRLTGTSYERLNWIHRSVSRCMLITALIHLSYFLRSWARYHYIQRKLMIDIHSQQGLGAFCVLAWLFVSSLAPIRGWRYEIFVIQHMISAIGFLVIVWIHIPDEANYFVWFPVGIWALDRLVRWGWLLYHNFSLFHPSTHKSGPLFACKATFTPLSSNSTKITIPNPPLSWKPGQHAFLTCHSLAPLQQHPFTISSLPSDGKLEFVIATHGGSTARFNKHACDCALPSPSVSQKEEMKTVIIDGPYGRMRPLEQFDTVVLFAGSTGASFTVPLLRDLLRRKTQALPLVTRRIRYVWVVKKRGQVEWFSQVLEQALCDLQQPGLSVEASIYVTCDPDLTSELSRLRLSPSSSDDSVDKKPSRNSLEKEATKLLVEAVDEKQTSCGPNGTCCCRDVVTDEDAIREDGAGGCCCCKPAADDDSKDAIMVADSPATGTTTTPSSVSSSSSFSGNGKRQWSLVDKVNFITGRPMVKNLIEKELEKARGETAVVVCGPSGLVQATRLATVELSDERAVHKGTGAQGVWLHCEAFSW